MPPPKKKGRGIAASFMKAEPDVTATRRGSPERGNIDLRSVQDIVNDPSGNRSNGNVLSTMDEHGIQDIVEHLGTGVDHDERAAMTSWNPSDPFSADNPEVAKQLRAESMARRRKFGK